MELGASKYAKNTFLKPAPAPTDQFIALTTALEQKHCNNSSDSSSFMKVVSFSRGIEVCSGNNNLTVCF